MIARRAFLFGLGLTGLAMRSSVQAQPAGKPARVGYVSTIAGGAPLADVWRKAFVDGLREHGWIESQSVIIEWRYAELEVRPRGRSSRS